jgi:hypothetical protein
MTKIASYASAYTRTGGGTGPNGNSWLSSGSGSCANGSCSSQQTLTGPAGNQATRKNGLQCAYGACKTSHKITGFGGGTLTRGSTFSH